MSTRQHYSDLRAAGKLHGTIKAAVEKRQERDKLQEEADESYILELIPLGPDHRRQAEKAARAKYPRRRNWDHAAETIHKSYVATINHGRYSSRCRYTRNSYRPQFRSCGCVTAGQALLLIGEMKYRFLAPRGWKYGRDANGLYLVRHNESRKVFRYHPNSDEWVRGIAAIRAAAINHESNQRKLISESRQKQRQQRSMQKAMKKFGVEVYVCFRDSYKSGNCAAGTATWARKNKINTRSHIPVKVIKRLAGDDRQVLRVVDYANARTLRECERGYSELSDHR